MARKRVLILAYYFPPMGLSGVQRTLKFAKYLPEFGWDPTVLTVEPAGYFAYDESLAAEVAEIGLTVHRTPSLDPTRLFGRRKTVQLPAERTRRLLDFLSQALFIPDNKVGWRISARRTAVELHAREPFDLIFSTAPPYTAHLIGPDLSKNLQLPLVLDFRDDWIGNPRHRYPTPLHRRFNARLEVRALEQASHIIVINDVIRRNILSRNVDVVEPGKVSVIPHGFDPADFERTPSPTAGSSPFTLLYSGVFYDAQTPEPLLRALAQLVDRHPDLRAYIRADFIGLLPESARQLARHLGIEKMIRHPGYLPHRRVIDELLAADVLWMTIGKREGAESISTSKLYEYFGAGKPILGLVPEGAARSELMRYGAAETVEPDDIAGIAAAVERLYTAWKRNDLPRPNTEFVREFDRRRLTGRLADIFHSATGGTR